MTTKKIIIMIMIACGSAIGCSSQGDHQHSQQIDHNSKEYSSRYICPMHCEGSGSDTTGNCPTCGMKYRLNPKFQEQ